MSPLRRRAPVMAALLVAALIRAADVDVMALWTDEGLSFYRAGLDLPGILSGIIPVGDHPTRDVQPPLYFLALGGWLRLAGFTAWAAKWLSLLWSLPAIALIWAIARRWAGRRAATWAGWLAALSPAYLWYAHEVRPYAMAIALAALGVYALDRGLGAWRGDATSAARAEGAGDANAAPEPRRRAAIGWLALAAAANAALVWTHYLGFFVVGFELALVLAVVAGPAVVRWRANRDPAPKDVALAREDAASSKPRSWAALAGAALLVVLAAAPLVPFAVRRLGTGIEKDQRFYSLDVLLRDMARGFALGTALDFERYRLLALVVATGAALLAALGAWHLWRTRRGGFWGATGWLLLPTTAFFALTLIQPRYQGVRHVLLQSPPYYVLVGAGLAALPGALAWAAPGARPRTHALLATATGLALLVAMAWADERYYADPSGHKGDLRAMARYVAEHALPGDALALSDPVLVYAVGQHLRELPGADPELIDLPATLASGQVDDRRPAEQLVPLLRRYDRLWTMRPPPELDDWLSAHARHVDGRSFPAGFGVPVRVSAWERLPAGDALPPPMEPLALGPLTLLGWATAGEPPSSPAGVWGAAPVPAGGLARVQLAWQPSERERPDLKVALQLLDAEDRNVADGDHEPFHGQLPTSRWPFGEIVLEPHDLRVPAAVPPGIYRLAVRVYRADGGAAYPAEGPAVIGELQVSRPEAPVPADALPLDGHLGAESAGATLVGWELARPEGGTYEAGAGLPLAIWIRVGELAQAPAALRAEVVDRLGRTLTEATAPLDLEGAQPGDLRRVALGPALPASAGRHDVRVRLLGDDGGPRWLRLGMLPVRGVWIGTVTSRAPERTSDLPSLSHPLDAAFGADVVLAGADLEDGADGALVARGAVVEATLYWQPLTTPSRALYASVQLVPIDVEDRPTGPPVAQHDGPPAEGTRPTTGWRPGEVVADRHVLEVPADLAPGRYALIAALYDPAAPDAPRPAVAQAGYDDARDFAVVEVVAIGE